MEEFKDVCQDLDVRIEELAVDLRDLPTDYKLAERYMDIDQEIYEMFEWYKKTRKEKIQMEERLHRVSRNLKLLNNEVQNIKLQEFSRAQRGGSYSQLHQIQHP